MASKKNQPVIARDIITKLLEEGIADRQVILEKTVAACNISLRRAEVVYGEVRGRMKRQASSAATPKVKASIIKASELIDRERLDYDKIIQESLKSFGPDDCIADEDLRRELGIPAERWRYLRDNEEYVNAYQVMLRKSRKRFWCHPKAKGLLLQREGVMEVL